MAFSPEEKAELVDVVRATVRAELNEYTHKCKILPDDSDAHEAELFISSVQNLGGDGKLSTAADIIRDNHKWLYKQRQRGENLNAAVYGIIVAALVSGILSALWIGLKKLVHAE